MGFLDSLKKAASNLGIETPNIDELVDKAVDKARSTVSELGVDVDRISSIAEQTKKKAQEAAAGLGLIDEEIKELNISVIQKALSKDKSLNVTPITDTAVRVTAVPSKEIPAKCNIVVELTKDALVMHLGISDSESARLLQQSGLDIDIAEEPAEVTRTVPFADIKTIKTLHKEVTGFIADIFSRLGANAAKDGIFDRRPFIPAVVRDLVRKMSGFVKIDDDGDAQFKFAQTRIFALQSYAWIYIKKGYITFDSYLTDFSFSGYLNAACKNAQINFPDWTFKVADGKIRIKRTINPADFNAASAETAAVERLCEFMAELPAAWQAVMKELGEACTLSDVFDLDRLRQALSKLPDYKLTDNDGDIKMIHPGATGFQIERFAWIFPKPTKVTIDACITDFKKHISSSTDIAKVIEAFNAKNTPFRAYDFKNVIRLKRVYELSSTKGADKTATILDDLKAGLDQAYKLLVDIARECGIKYDYYKPTISDTEKALRALPNVKNVTTIDGGNGVRADLYQSTTTDKCPLAQIGIDVRINDNNSTTVKCYFHFFEKVGNDSYYVSIPFLETISEMMAKASGDIFKPFWASGDNAGAEKSFECGTFATFDIFKKTISLLHDLAAGIMPKVTELRLEEINKAIEKENKAIEERNKERERESQRQREAMRNNSFTLNLCSDVTIRDIQEVFTDEYPYLRIGFYMVKTAKQANTSGGTIESIDSDTYLGNIRSFKSDKRFTIYGKSTPKEIEAGIRSSTGLTVKLGYNDENDERYYISPQSRFYTTAICDINEEFRNNGYQRADIS